MTTLEVGDLAPDPPVFDPDGWEVSLSSYWRDRPAVLVFLRHYG